ncbi:bloodthirsty-related gene family, member 12 [Megalops cyprinoides]|uniref:bloodthirsty-related gene family, member 12 n=1 Tax=Megalops cyprinoides TaxID=118141 RepID=UPI001865563B|nr:bloodthirsty-related gene family, member 12 [Megalops cyprinoides]
MQSVGSPGGRTISEEQFLCSICLEVFVEPVSTPCGHSFCKACLQGYWSHSKQCLCPMCKKSFPKRPELSVNRVLAEISAHFQGLGVAEAGPAEQEGGDFARPGEVPCDSCIGKKLKAARSCLTCAGSFCEAHLQLHRKVRAPAAHHLVPPIPRLSDKICKKHQRLLEAYCRSDHTCVCPTCADATHKTHDIVSADREWKKKMSQLGKRRSEVKHLIKERAKKLEEIKQSIKVIKSSAQRELEESWRVYAELQRWVEQSQAELVERIATRQREAERQAQELARGLEEELALLRRRSSELEELAHTDDKVLFLQGHAALPPPLEPMDWSGVSVNTDLYVGTVRSSVSALLERFQEELKTLFSRELRKLQNYASEVFLDPATAQRNLVLSEDGKQVWYEEHRQAVAESGRRFQPALFVLAREGLSSGRHYWEVDVGGKTAWTLGMARQSARRKGEIKLSPGSGFWCLWLKGGQIKALSSTRLPLQLATPPHKVGIYLDYEAGQVSFYDVKARSHLYTFMDAFSESLFPIFSPCLNQDGKNSGPLVISPVKHS